MSVSFHLKRAIVTGAGKGIGRAIAFKLAKLGSEVHAISRTQSDLESLRKECSTINVCNVDISDWDKTRSVIKGIGVVDFLVNNAGVFVEAPFLDVTKDQLDTTHDINFKAAYNISQVVAKGMVEAGNGGSIINMSSAAGLKPGPSVSLYCTSKAALDMLTRNMALELGPYNIRVNSINPGVVLSTPMTIKSSLGTAEVQQLWVNLTPLGKLTSIDDVVNHPGLPVTGNSEVRRTRR